jgi:nucleoside-diphosphate-sugar epimerase
MSSSSAPTSSCTSRTRSVEDLREHLLELGLLRRVVVPFCPARQQVLGQQRRVVAVKAVGGHGRGVDEALRAGGHESYVFRPCIVAGPDALALLANIPYVQLSLLGSRIGAWSAPVRRALEAVPALRPVLPDPGVPFQLVHHDDVATALRAAVLGRGTPGVRNLAGSGELTFPDLAGALGWYSVPVSEVALDAAAGLVTRLPFMPAEAQWIESFRTPVLMDTSKARRKLRWRPRHDARETLDGMVEAARAAGLVR